MNSLKQAIGEKNNTRLWRMSLLQLKKDVVPPSHHFRATSRSVTDGCPRILASRVLAAALTQLDDSSAPLGLDVSVLRTLSPTVARGDPIARGSDQGAGSSKRLRSAAVSSRGHRARAADRKSTGQVRVKAGWPSSETTTTRPSGLKPAERMPTSWRTRVQSGRPSAPSQSRAVRSYP